MSKIVYDVEVAIDPKEVDGGWENPEGMGFASAVTYSYVDDQYRFWLGPGNLNPLIDFLAENEAITFNGIKFDSRVLLGNDRKVSPYGITWIETERMGAIEQGAWWNNYDILLEYLRIRFDCADVAEAEKKLGDKTIYDGSFGLNGLAEGTLGLHKTGHGAKAPILYQNENYAELLSYNLQDVRLTKKLYDFIRRYGFLVDRAGRVIRMKI